MKIETIQWGYDDCDFCNGKGEVEVKGKENITEDCDMCNGTGIVKCMVTQLTERS